MQTLANMEGAMAQDAENDAAWVPLRRRRLFVAFATGIVALQFKLDLVQVAYIRQAQKRQ